MRSVLTDKELPQQGPLHVATGRWLTLRSTGVLDGATEQLLGIAQITGGDVGRGLGQSRRRGSGRRGRGCCWALGPTTTE